METLRLVMVTIPVDEARSMAKSIVEGKLAACVNIVSEIDSFFFWQGAVQNDKEALLLIKSIASRFTSLMDHIKENHPYELPEIISIDLSECSPDYAKWVVSETAEP